MAGGLLLPSLTGQQRALVDVVTITNAKKNPLLALLPKGGRVNNINYEWPLDLEETPEPNAHIDGEDAKDFKNAEENYTMVANRCQWSFRDYRVGELAEDEPVAGIKDHRAYAIKKALAALMADIEGTLGSDQDVVAGSGAAANKCRGIGKWISTSITTSGYSVSSNFLPSSDAVFTSALAALTPGKVNTILQAVWEKGGVSGNEVLPLVTGATTKNVFTTFPNYSSGSTDALAAVQTYTASATAKTVWRTVTRFEGDYGTIELIPTTRNALSNFPGGSAAANTRRGYLLNPKFWDIIWRWAPKIKPLPDLGGGPRFRAHAFWGLRCMKPDANAAIKSTT